MGCPQPKSHVTSTHHDLLPTYFSHPCGSSLLIRVDLSCAIQYLYSGQNALARAPRLQGGVRKDLGIYLTLERYLSAVEAPCFAAQNTQTGRSSEYVSQEVILLRIAIVILTNLAKFILPRTRK